MRVEFVQPGQQLQSVALRYRSPLCPATSGAGTRSDLPHSICLRCDPPHISGLRQSDHPRRRDADLARLEAVLFIAREPLGSRKLAQYANLADGTQARTLVRRLNEHYDAAGRAFRVEQVAGGYQLLTRRQFSPWLRRLAHVPGETRLSAPGLETLAVIAYRQPVPRADIEAIRGVNCGEILRQLLERDLVRIDGRSEELGRPYLYSTTKRFLELFGLIHLDDLPGDDGLRSAPLPVAAGAVTIFSQPAEYREQDTASLEVESTAESTLDADTAGDWTNFEIQLLSSDEHQPDEDE
jgi:segregation and condensation protein B